MQTVEERQARIEEHQERQREHDRSAQAHLEAGWEMRDYEEEDMCPEHCARAHMAAARAHGVAMLALKAAGFTLPPETADQVRRTADRVVELAEETTAAAEAAEGPPADPVAQDPAADLQDRQRAAERWCRKYRHIAEDRSDEAVRATCDVLRNV